MEYSFTIKSTDSQTIARAAQHENAYDALLELRHVLRRLHTYEEALTYEQYQELISIYEDHGICM